MSDVCNASELLRARVAELETIIGLNGDYVRSVAVAFDLPPRMAALLALLLNLPVVSAETVVNEGIATDAKVAMHRLRRYLEPMGIGIIGRRGFGWKLTDESKSKLKAKLEGNVTSTVTSVAEAA